MTQRVDGAHICACPQGGESGCPPGRTAHNGRIYDPHLGRFLSPDPHIQAPFNLQSYNRYSYVNNNPLSYTDPSGYGFFSDTWDSITKPLKKLAGNIARAFSDLWKPIVSSFLSAIPVVGPYLALAFNAYMGYRSGGIIGGITAAVTYAAGSQGQSFGENGFNSGMIRNLRDDGGGGPFGFVENLPKSVQRLTRYAQTAARVFQQTRGRIRDFFSASDPPNHKFENGAGTRATGYLDDQSVTKINQQTEISIGYTEATGYGVHGQHHAFVIARNPLTGEQYAVRAGPGSGFGGSRSAGNSAASASGGSVLASAGEGGSGGHGFGAIRAEHGIYNESFRDPPSLVLTTQLVGYVNASFSDVVAWAGEFSSITNANKIPYRPLTLNSNSFAFTFIESLGFPRPSPAVGAPGWMSGRPDSSLSYFNRISP